MTDPTEAPYTIPLKNRLARQILKPIFQGLFHLLARIKVTGQENVPFGKPYIVAFNHISTFDPPLVVAFWPEMAEIMGAVDIWNRPGQAQLARLYYAIQVHRGDYDRELIDDVLRVLAAGKPLVLAPEGGRSHEKAMHRARPGVAFLVEKAQVPVIPVGIIGTTDDFFKRAIRFERRLLEMRIGKPFELPEVTGKGEQRRESRQRNADLVMTNIARLLPEEYSGVYAENSLESLTMAHESS